MVKSKNAQIFFSHYRPCTQLIFSYNEILIKITLWKIWIKSIQRYKANEWKLIVSLAFSIRFISICIYVQCSYFRSKDAFLCSIGITFRFVIQIHNVELIEKLNSRGISRSSTLAMGTYRTLSLYWTLWLPIKQILKYSKMELFGIT